MQKIKCTLVHINNDESLTPQIKFTHCVVESVGLRVLSLKSCDLSVQPMPGD